MEKVGKIEPSGRIMELSWDLPEPSLESESEVPRKCSRRALSPSPSLSRFAMPVKGGRLSKEPGLPPGSELQRQLEA